MNIALGVFSLVIGCMYGLFCYFSYRCIGDVFGGYRSLWFIGVSSLAAIAGGVYTLLFAAKDSMVVFVFLAASFAIIILGSIAAGDKLPEAILTPRILRWREPLSQGDDNE